MNTAAFRLLSLVLAVTTSATSYNIVLAGSLSDGIDNIFGKLTGAEQPEFLDPDEAFIVSALEDCRWLLALQGQMPIFNQEGQHWAGR